MLGYTIASKSRPAEIMLIEDNFGDVILIRKALQTTGITSNIQVADDGQMAFDMLHRRGAYASASLPDIILLDINLPKMNGVEVLRTIKEDSVLRRIPVIVMSSSKARTDISRCYDLHANAYIIKPANMEKLVEVMQAISQFWFNLVLYVDHTEH